MPDPGGGVVRVTTPRATTPQLTAPRSVVRTQRSSVHGILPDAFRAPSLLPLVIPASIAAAAFLGKLFSRKRRPEKATVIEWHAEIVTLVVTRSEK